MRKDFVDLVVDFHRHRRPYQSPAEKAMQERLKQVGFTECEGGLIRWGTCRELFLTAHTDTWGDAGKNDLQIVDGFLELADTTRHAGGRVCLGADDGAGLVILYCLAQQRTDLTLFAPTGEEHGLIGSTQFCQAYKDQLPRVVISLDRRGYNSVITHQQRGRTCSDEFAQRLAALLGRDYAPDPTGLRTDSAAFAEAGCQECTNISVGYEFPHSPEERLRLDFLEWLTMRLIDCDLLSLLE